MMDDEPTTTSETSGGESEADIIADLSARATEQRLEQTAQQAESRQQAEEPAASGDDEGGDGAQEPPEQVEKPRRTETKDHDDELSADDRLSQARAAIEAGDLEKAFLLAFEHKPEFFQVNPAKFTALREAQRKERQKTEAAARTLERNQQQFQGQVRQTVAQLQPYAKYYQAEQAYRQSGDSSQLRAIVEGITGKSYDEAQKEMLHDTRRSPGETRLQKELEAVRRELQQMQQQRDQHQQQRTAEQQKQADLQVIQQQLGSHDVAKVPNYVERVYRVLAKHFDPNLGGLQISVEDAAAAVLRGERRRVESSPLYRKPPPAAATPPRRPKPNGSSSPPLRRDSQNNGTHSGEESLDDIINDIQGQIARQKMNQRRASS